MTLRGPDAHDSWNDGKVGLGQTRLSIIDTSDRGLQPMADTTGKYMIIYNGEVYNYKEIKKDLLAKGYSFHSETDTEVVLNAFIEWGPQCLQRFNGFFGFAIYSLEDHKLFIARDRFGIKPLMYIRTNSYFAFASELKALVDYGWERKMDKESLNLFFQLTYIPSPKSIFEGVEKLEPGQFLLIDGEDVRKEKYFEVPYTDSPQIQGFDDAKSKVRETLQRSVIDRLVSDVPLGSFLSGGIDSSIVTSIAAQEVEDFKTFSIGFTENRFFDETKYAELLSKRYRTDHHTFPLSNEDLYEHLDNIVNYLDEPFADSSAIPVYILSERTRKHVTVALSGDGADEVFSGYNKHIAWQMSNSEDLRNRLLKKGAPIFKLLPKSRGNVVSNFFRQLDRYVDVLNLTRQDKYWLLASFGSEKLRNGILNSDYFYGLEDYRSEAIDTFNSTNLNRFLAQDVKTVLQGDMLPKVDFMSMANSLEVRVPFLDPNVVEAAFNIPESMKVKGNTRKYVLREAFRDDLPHELYERGKQGFEVPLMEWFKGPMRSQLDNVIFDRDKIESQKIFNWSGLEELRKKLFSKNPEDSVIHTWQLFVFQKWWEKYFN